ncbi:MAG: glutathione S-transferase family protein [Myxococcota bacterium]|nr:glutathione S-transferase family protein [Myxococcales bacterium]
MIRLYDYLPSGNGYKVRLLLAQLGIEHEVVELDIAAGETHTAAFLALNPNGKIPAVELGDGRALAESHAILQYFGEGTSFVPVDAYERAQMWQWMCFEQYSLEPFIGTLRYWRHSLGRSPAAIGEERYREKLDGGHRALGILDAALADRAWLVASAYTLADIALYAYTHVADEGDFELARFPHVLAWHERVRAQPRHVPITHAEGSRSLGRN